MAYDLVWYRLYINVAILFWKRYTSFAGIAGIISSRKGVLIVEHETLDWLTEVFQETSKKAHGIDNHLNDLRDKVQPHIDMLRKKLNLPSDSPKIKLAIQISGWVGDVQFHCVIDNYLDNYSRTGPTRPYFKTRYKLYEDRMFEDGSKIIIIGQEFISENKDHLFEGLFEVSRRENPKEIFETSVKIIRTAAVNSNGYVGFNCSGVRISRSDHGIQVFDDRDQSVWDVVMPNTTYSTSQISLSTKNMRGRKL